MNKFCFILLCFPALLFGQQTIIKEINIKPYMYTQNYEHFKRLVLDSPNSEAEYVDGFDFEWGYFYKLKVKEIYLGELPDGTNYEYSLLKEISKEKVSDTLIFFMSIDPLKYYHKLEEKGISNYTLSQLNDSTYLYMDQVEIEIPQNFLESFIKKKENEINIRGDFEIINGKRIRLVRFR